MPNVQLFLFDDEIARAWEPFALTRPVGELLFGTMTFRQRAERVVGTRCVGHLATEHLAGFDEPGAAPVLTRPAPDTAAPRLFLLSRFVPDWGAEDLAADRGEGPITSGDGDVVGWFAPAGADNPNPDFLLQPHAPSTSPGSAVTGKLLAHIWELVTGCPDQITRDIDALFPGPIRTTLPDGVHYWGEFPLILDPTAVIEPGSAFDTSHGPIWIDRDAEVRAFTRLAGPAYVGHRSVVLGGHFEAVTIGPVCKVHGEMAESVCLGYVNKQHDGHIGHAYLGRWVNLGAGTNNSDLKNDYGSIRVWTPAGEVDTGETKIGSLIGDHVKTGIGLLLNTGTVIGAGSNLFGSAMPPTYVPPFSWGTGSQLSEYRLDKFLEVAGRAMSRRDVELSESMREQLGRSWRRGRDMEGS